jgi:uncharacterized membrane protein
MAGKIDTLYVTGATYNDTKQALADFDAVYQIYKNLGTTTDFDAAVIEKDKKGRVKIVKTREEASRHGASVGLAWGLAAGLAAALFPAIGIWTALTAGGAMGSMIGALAGHATMGMKRNDLKMLGEALDAGQAGLLVVYAANRADQIAKVLTSANMVKAELQNAAVEDLADAVNAAKDYKAPRAAARV